MVPRSGIIPLPSSFNYFFAESYGKISFETIREEPPISKNGLLPKQEVGIGLSQSHEGKNLERILCQKLPQTQINISFSLRCLNQ